MKTPPNTLGEAVAIGLSSLTGDARKELAEVRFVDPHTKHRTDFEKIVAEALGLNDGSNPELLVDVAINHADKLNFLEADGQAAQPRAVLRIVLAEMAKVVQAG